MLQPLLNGIVTPLPDPFLPHLSVSAPGRGPVGSIDGETKFALPLGMPAAAFGAIFPAPLATSSSCRSSSIPLPSTSADLGRCTFGMFPEPLQGPVHCSLPFKSHVAFWCLPAPVPHSQSARDMGIRACASFPEPPCGSSSGKATRPHFNPPSLLPSLHNVIEYYLSALLNACSKKARQYASSFTTAASVGM